uniref:Uncharacterized protein n=1 Tax=Romanomermis culicivorax TaxID=13658 RepID=A0A915JZK9_ROMCU
MEISLQVVPAKLEIKKLISESRCIRGRQSWYKAAMGGGYGKGQQTWPWTTMHGSSSSESGAALSVTGPAKGSGGSAAEYYPDLAIPRAKLRADRNEQRRRADHLQGYLTADSDAESAIRIPRARLGNETIERNTSVQLADVNQPAMRAVAVPRRTGAFSDSSFADDSSSTASSDYTTHEEVERRVITDVKKTETSKTTTAQIHNATAQFLVYPPVTSMGGKAAKSIYEAFSGLKKLARSSSGKKQSTKNQQSAQPNPELIGQTSSNTKELYGTSAATNTDNMNFMEGFTLVNLSSKFFMKC